MIDGVELSDNVLRDATHSLHTHLGSLMDLPEELRNTIASVYYEVHWLRRGEGTVPPVNHLLPRKDPQKQLDAAMKQAILRTDQYRIIATLVEGIREANKDTQPNLYGTLVQLALDTLKWNIKNSFKKSELRRSLEKIGKKPVPEIPGVYKRMRQLSFEQEPSPFSHEDNDSEWITLDSSARVTRSPKK